MFLLNKVTTMIWVFPVALSVEWKMGNNCSCWGQANENTNEHITEFSKDVPRIPFYEAGTVMKEVPCVSNPLYLIELNAWHRYWPFRKTRLRVPQGWALRAPCACSFLLSVTAIFVLSLSAGQGMLCSWLKIRIISSNGMWCCCNL